MLAGAAALGGDRRRPSRRGSGARRGLNRLPRIEKQVLVTLPADSRAGNVMWLLSVGGRVRWWFEADAWRDPQAQREFLSRIGTYRDEVRRLRNG